MADALIKAVWPVEPWHLDHHFLGRTLLPAVAMMELLAQTVHEALPACRCTTIENALFRKFFEIPAGAATIDLQVEIREAAGRIHTRLSSRQTFATLSRLVCHCQLDFAADRPDADDQPGPEPMPSGPSVVAIPTQRLYAELVPFGPSLHSLQGELLLAGNWAWGKLAAAESPGAVCGLLGSPFPCDGAMHAACVHGQRLVDFIPFPVAFSQRRIHRPSRPGGRYTCQVQLSSQTADALVYCLTIWDETGSKCETITGLEMRDVSGGTIRPPQWLKEC